MRRFILALIFVVLSGSFVFYTNCAQFKSIPAPATELSSGNQPVDQVQAPIETRLIDPTPEGDWSTCQELPQYDLNSLTLVPREPNWAPVAGVPFSGNSRFTTNYPNYGSESAPLNCRPTTLQSPLRQPPNFDYGSPPLCNLGVVSPPPVGGSYRDPNFGSEIQTLARNAYHHYSFQTAINRNSTVAIGNRCDGTFAFSLETGQSIWNRIPVSIGETRWSRLDPDIFYSLKGRQIFRGNVRTRQLEPYMDLSLPPYSFQEDPTTGGNHDLAEGDYTGFFSNTRRIICVVKLPTKTGRCIPIAPPEAVARVPIEAAHSGSGFDLNMTKTFDSETGKLYVVLFAKPTFAVYTLGPDPATLAYAFRGPEVHADFQPASETHANGNGFCDAGEKCLEPQHNDFTHDATGRQFILPFSVVRNCVVTYSYFQISKAERMLVPVSQGGGRYDVRHLIEHCGGNGVWTFADHVGCSTDSPNCVISLEYAFPANGRLVPNGTEPYMSELFLFRDLGREIRRIGAHRSTMNSTNSGDSYWDQPRPAISADGGIVVFTSNFGTTGRRRLMKLKTGL